jgi:hypothetical protein
MFKAIAAPYRDLNETKAAGTSYSIKTSYLTSNDSLTDDMV